MPLPLPALESSPLENLSPPPDWEKVFCDVSCPRCGFNLRGRSEPRCPSCDLSFNWSEVAPMEEITCLHCGYHLYGLNGNRCPECGNEFSWNFVLDRYRRRRKPLFEYHWRVEPLRTLRSTLGLLFRPWKLWSMIDIHDPPARDGLIVLTMLSLVILVAGPIGAGTIGHWIALQLEPIGFASSGWAVFGGQSWGEWGLSFGLWSAIVVWASTTLGTLLLLRQSMRLCRVRNTHVYRVFVYTLLMMCVIQSCWWFLLFVLQSLVAVRPQLFLDMYFEMAHGLLSFLLIFSVIWAVLMTAFAYRRYLRMKHAWAVALYSQIIAAMTALLVSVLVTLWQNRGAL